MPVWPINGTIHVIGGSGDHKMQKLKSSQLLASLELDNDDDDGGGVMVKPQTSSQRPCNQTKLFDIRVGRVCVRWAILFCPNREVSLLPRANSPDRPSTHAWMHTG